MSFDKTNDMFTSEKHIDNAVSEQSKAGVLMNDLEDLTLSQILARLQVSNEAPRADKSGSLIPRRFANPAPLGLGAFALTAFISSATNMRAHSNITPDAVVALAFCYGGLVQLLAGMWYARFQHKPEILKAHKRSGKWLLETPSVLHLSLHMALSGSHMPSFHSSKDSRLWRT